MDKDQARFLLRNLRPDGSDAGDPAFAAALDFACRDPETAAWLESERTLDTEFAAAFASVEAPAGLRQRLLDNPAANFGDLPQATDALDREMIGSLAGWRPPGTLRGEILTAMERSSVGRQPAPHRARRWLVPAAAAAGVALAIIVQRPEGAAEDPVVELNPPTQDLSAANASPVASVSPAATPISLSQIEDSFIRTYGSPLFSLDENRENHEELLAHLEARRLPCPKQLPPGLARVKGIGCRELIIEGKRGSLVCFDERVAGPVHLVILRREDVSCRPPCRQTPSMGRRGHWSIARWSDDDHIFVLVGATDLDRLRELF